MLLKLEIFLNFSDEEKVQWFNDSKNGRKAAEVNEVRLGCINHLLIFKGLLFSRRTIMPNNAHVTIHDFKVDTVSESTARYG